MGISLLIANVFAPFAVDPGSLSSVIKGSSWSSRIVAKGSEKHRSGARVSVRVLACVVEKYMRISRGDGCRGWVVFHDVRLCEEVRICFVRHHSPHPLPRTYTHGHPGFLGGIVFFMSIGFTIGFKHCTVYPPHPWRSRRQGSCRGQEWNSVNLPVCGCYEDMLACGSGRFRASQL